MRRRYLLSVLFFLFSLVFSFAVNAQAVFSISEIDASEFPTIKASFVALTQGGNSYPDLQKNDFAIKDMGQDVSPSVFIDCKDSLVDPAISVILILDKSQSMKYQYETGETRWDWVKEGAKSFINTINLNNGSRIGIIAFSKLAGIKCDFTDDKKELIDSINSIKVLGATEYDPPILDYRYGAVNMFKKGSPNTKTRRIAIFLTDGDPNHTPSVDSIKKELNNANIQFYAITLGMPMNKKLSEIAIATGGKAFAVFTKEELNEIYKYIAVDVQRKEICTLFWEAPFTCTELSRYHDVEITFKPQNVRVQKKYFAPPSSVAYIELSNPFLEFGNPAANASVDLDLTLTAKNSDFDLRNTSIIPATFFQIIDWDINSGAGSDPPFILKKDSSRTIKVRFTQGNTKLYRQAQLIFEGSPCPPTVQLIGGITQIRIVKPNGGEIYSTCDTVEIQWAGVESNKPVNLSFSSNDGKNWRSIANNVRGLRYFWKPPSSGTEYKVRATVAPISNYKWAKSIGGTGNENGASIAVTKDNRYLYITGGFEGTVDFGVRKVSSRGAKDIFLAKCDSDGNILWVETAGGPGYDSANAVCVDEAGNAYITGVCFNNSKFGNITPTIPIQGLSNCFIARYSPNGGTPAVQLIGANSTYTSFRAGGNRIRFREAEKEIDIRGTYLNAVQSSYGYSLPKVTRPTAFTAVMKSDLTFVTVNRGGTNYPDYSKRYSIDSDGNRYNIGNYTNDITFGTFSFTSAGGQDIFVNKFGGTPGSKDISDDVFSVVSPVINFAVNSVLFEETLLGVANDTLLKKQLCNIGTLPVEITAYNFSGANPDDFKLTSNPISIVLKPGDCIPLEIVFQPTDIGARSAKLVISATCSQDIVLDLSGDGVCGGESISEIDFGRINLSFKKDSIVTCIFKNTNPTTVTVKPNLSGANAGDFSIDQSSFFVESDSCLKLTVSFTPSAAGQRTAAVEFQLPNGCINPVTTLKGFGVVTELSLNSIHWGDRRVKTSNDSAIIIRNTSILPAKIDSIAFSTKPGNEFTLLNSPTLPYNIPANDSLVLKVNFTPQNEQFYSNNINIYAQGNATPLTSTIDGNGILPKILGTWICDTATIPGSTSIAELVIENPSKTADLKIYKINFKYSSSEFTWVSGPPPTNEIIPKETKKTYYVTFAPTGAGTRSNLIEISHDAKPGPDIAPVADTTVDVLCDGLGLTVPDTLNFKGVLICDNYLMELRLENTSWQKSITVKDVQITGEGAKYFSINFVDSLLVPSGNFKILTVTFAPETIGEQKAKLLLKTSVGYNVSVDLLGIGEYLYYSADNQEYEIEPGYIVKIPVRLRVNELAKQTIPELKMQIAYNSKMLRYDRIKYNDYPNWTWDNPVLSKPGLIDISGGGSLATAFNNRIFEIQFTVFLADVKKDGIKLHPIMGACDTKDTTITSVKYAPFCFMDGRLVVTNNTNYYLQTPEPNPASENATIKFGIGLDGITSISLYSVMGELITSYINKELKAGNYEFDIKADNLSTGNYFLVLRSGHIVKTMKMIINK